jgi:hypothetical protein
MIVSTAAQTPKFQLETRLKVSFYSITYNSSIPPTSCLHVVFAHNNRLDCSTEPIAGKKSTFPRLSAATVKHSLDWTDHVFRPLRSSL